MGIVVRYVIKSILILSISCVNVFAQDIDCSKSISNFVKKPNAALFNAITSDSCKNNLIAFEEHELFYMLLKNVKNGKKYSALYLSMNLRNTDGAYYEDSLEALGVYSDIDMPNYTSLIINNKIEKKLFIDSIIITPQKYVDDFSSQMNILKKRKISLLKLHKTKVIEKLISMINKEIKIMEIDN